MLSLQWNSLYWLPVLEKSGDGFFELFHVEQFRGKTYKLV